MNISGPSNPQNPHLSPSLEPSLPPAKEVVAPQNSEEILGESLLKKSFPKKDEIFQLEVNGKRFAHEVAGPLVNNTELEGSCSIETTQWIEDLWKPVQELAGYYNLTEDHGQPCGLEGLSFKQVFTRAREAELKPKTHYFDIHGNSKDLWKYKIEELELVSEAIDPIKAERKTIEGFEGSWRHVETDTWIHKESRKLILKESIFVSEKDEKALAELEEVQYFDKKSGTDRQVFIQDLTRLNKSKKIKGLQESISRLQPGDFFVIRQSVEVYKKQGRHAINLVIQKQEKNGLLDIAIINTGAGLNYHEQQQSGNKILYRSSQRFINVDPKKINTEKFWRIVESSCLDSLYKLFYNYVGFYGQRVYLPYHLDIHTDPLSELFTTAQPSGICGSQVMLETLKFIAFEQTPSLDKGKANHKRTLLLYKILSCISIAHHYIQKGKFKHSQDSLISKSLPVLRDRLEKAYKEKLIPDHCYGDFKATLLDIGLSIEKIKSEAPKPKVVSWTTDFVKLNVSDAIISTPKSVDDNVVIQQKQDTLFPRGFWGNLAGDFLFEKISSFKTFYEKNAPQLREIGKASLPYGLNKQQEAQNTHALDNYRDSLDCLICEVPYKIESGLSEEERVRLFEELSSLHHMLCERFSEIDFYSRQERLVNRKRLIVMIKLEFLMYQAAQDIDTLKKATILTELFQRPPLEFLGVIPDSLNSDEKSALSQLDTYYWDHIAPKQDKSHNNPYTGFLKGEDDPSTCHFLKKLGVKKELLSQSATDINIFFNTNPLPVSNYLDRLASKELLLKALKSSKEEEKKQPFNLKKVNWIYKSESGSSERFGWYLATEEKELPLTCSPLLPQNRVDKLGSTPSCKEDLSLFLDTIEETLRQADLGDSSFATQLALVAIHNLHKLPLPKSPLWKTTNAVEKKSYLKKVRSIHGHLNSLLRRDFVGNESPATPLLLSQGHLLLIYFEILASHDPSKSYNLYRLDLPELQKLPELSLSFHLPEYRVLFRALSHHMRVQEVNSGSNYYIAPFFKKEKASYSIPQNFPDHLYRT